MRLGLGLHTFGWHSTQLVNIYGLPGVHSANDGDGGAVFPACHLPHSFHRNNLAGPLHICNRRYVIHADVYVDISN